MGLHELWKESWPYFEPHEVLSDDGMAAFQDGVILVQGAALDYLQDFRVSVGLPFLINHAGHRLRGFRSHEENIAAGGREYSMHTFGLAFDVSVPGMPVEWLFEKAVAFGWSGVGLYKTFVHMDGRLRLDGKCVTWKEDK